MKNDQKGFIVPFLLGILAVLLIGGAVYLYESKKADAPFSSGTDTQMQDSLQQTASENTPPTTVAVDGMQQYTDSKFGFSFWYPTSWNVKSSASLESIPFTGGTLGTAIVVGPSKDTTGTIVVQEFTSSTTSITDGWGCGPSEACGQARTYYFDASVHKWMTQNHRFDGSTDTSVADISSNSMGGLHLFPGNARFGDDFIIPLSAKHFLIVYTLDEGGVREDYVAATVTASDPSVATPVSISEQINTIRNEGFQYNALGKSIENEWYVFGQNVYDRLGNVILGANAATFKNITAHSDGFVSPTEFATDGSHVYCDCGAGAGNGGELIKGADSATFIPIRQEYQIPFAKSSGAYGQSFASYNNTYEKDKSHVWDGNKLVPGADPKTFVVIGDAARYVDGYDESKGVTLAKDAHHTYGEDIKGNVTVDGVTVKG